MDIKDMEYMVTIVKEGSLSKAADKLYITQSVLSRLVIKMEDLYQVQLFKKNRLPWKLTLAGEIFINDIKKILAIEKSLVEEMLKFSTGLKGRLIIGSMPLEERYFIAEFLPLLKEKYKNFEIETIIKFSEEIENLILDNVIDVGIVVEPVKSIAIESIPLITYKILIVTSMNHPLAKNYKRPAKGVFPKIKVSEFGKYPVALPKEGLGLRDIALNFLKVANIKPNVVISIAGFEAVHNFIGNDCGLGFTVDEEEYLKNIKDDIAYFEVADYSLTQTVSFAYKKGRALTGIEKTLLTMFKEKVENKHY